MKRALIIPLLISSLIAANDGPSRSSILNISNDAKYQEYLKKSAALTEEWQAQATPFFLKLTVNYSNLPELKKKIEAIRHNRWSEINDKYSRTLANQKREEIKELIEIQTKTMIELTNKVFDENQRELKNTKNEQKLIRLNQRLGEMRIQYKDFSAYFGAQKNEELAKLNPSRGFFPELDKISDGIHNAYILYFKKKNALAKKYQATLANHSPIEVSKIYNMGYVLVLEFYNNSPRTIIPGNTELNISSLTEGKILKIQNTMFSQYKSKKINQYPNLNLNTPISFAPYSSTLLTISSRGKYISPSRYKPIPKIIEIAAGQYCEKFVHLELLDSPLKMNRKITLAQGPIRLRGSMEFNGKIKPLFPFFATKEYNEYLSKNKLLKIKELTLLNTIISSAGAQHIDHSEEAFKDYIPTLEKLKNEHKKTKKEYAGYLKASASKLEDEIAALKEKFSIPLNATEAEQQERKASRARALTFARASSQQERHQKLSNLLKAEKKAVEYATNYRPLPAEDFAKAWNENQQTLLKIRGERAKLDQHYNKHLPQPIALDYVFHADGKKHFRFRNSSNQPISRLDLILTERDPQNKVIRRLSLSLGQEQGALTTLKPGAGFIASFSLTPPLPPKLNAYFTAPLVQLRLISETHALSKAIKFLDLDQDQNRYTLDIYQCK